MRERSTGWMYTDVETLSGTSEQHSYKNGVLTFSDGATLTGTLRRNQWSKTMFDVVTPNWKKLRDTGVVVNNPMNQEFQTIERRPCWITGNAQWEDASNSATSEIQGVYHPYDVGIGEDATNSVPQRGHSQMWETAPYEAWVGSDDSDSRIREATSALYAKVADAPLSAWVIVGEFNESIRTIVWILQRVKGLLTLLHRGKSKSALKELNRRIKSGRVLQWEDFAELSDAYLQVRYGIRPLVYDLMGALEALRELGNKTRQRFGHSAGEEVIHQDTVYYTHDMIGGTLTPNLSNQCEYKHTFAVRAGLLAHPVFEEANLLTVIGAGEGVKAVWDLIPYSFVIDWFLTTQELFTSWSPNALVRVLASWAIVEETQSITTEVLPGGCHFPSAMGNVAHTPRVNESLSVTSGLVRHSFTKKSRIPEPPRAVVPSLKLNLSAAKAVDILALSKQFGRFRHGL